MGGIDLDAINSMELQAKLVAPGLQNQANTMFSHAPTVSFGRTAASKGFNNTAAQALSSTGNPFDVIQRNQHPQQAAERIVELER